MLSSGVIYTAAAVGGVILWALVSRWLTVSNPAGTIEAGIVWRLFKIYVRVVHRLKVEGLEHVPHSMHPGPLVVVANHTAGVDPILIQAVVRFEVRWMMATDMQAPELDWVWEIGKVIGVRGEGDAGAAREAIRHVKSGGVLGIFPEGRLERPARQLRPFVPGVGLVVKRTGAPVLIAIVDGTPQVDPAWASLWRFSRARLRFLPMVRYEGTALSAGEIAEDLQQRFEAATGWPVNVAARE